MHKIANDDFALAGTLPKPTTFAENSGGHGSECYDRNRQLLKERKKVDDNGSAEFERRKSCPPHLTASGGVGFRQTSHTKHVIKNAMRARRLQCGLSPKSQFRYGCLGFVTRKLLLMTIKFRALMSVIGLGTVCVVQALSPTQSESPTASNISKSHIRS
jgi:hypothetical protein